MNRILVGVLATALSGCDAPFWQKQKRDDAEIARQQSIRAMAQETWHAEERRRLLALCLDIAKFEKQWNNFAEWSFDASNGGCTVSYKKPPSEIKTETQCADLWLKGKGERDGNGPSATAPSWKQRLYYNCASDTFSKVWNVQVAKETSP